MAAALRAGPSYGLPGQALTPVTQTQSISRGQFFVSPGDQFRMSFDNVPADELVSVYDCHIYTPAAGRFGKTKRK